MSCNCIGNFYTDSNGNSQPLTEFMCFEIIAQNSFCCDTFDKSCLNTIYFYSTSENYVGCYGCPSENSNCCYLIQSEANKINPNANSQCCENFDSYCIEAYETLKNTKGNFCSDNSSLKDYYVNTYSTDYRPCNFTDEQADQCVAELNCSQFNSEQCLDSLYSKLTDYSSACQCTCFKQASFLSTCILNVIHKEPTCCHSWTAECEYIKNELEKIPNGPCSKVIEEGDGSLAGGLGGPGTFSCGCTVQNTDWSGMPCDVYNFFCESEIAQALGYSCTIGNVGAIISDYMENQTFGLCNDVPLNSQICSSGCPSFTCLSCAEQGYSSDFGLEWYDILLECDACAWAIASVVFPSIASSTDCNEIAEGIRIVRLAATIVKTGQGGSISASDCSECCALCRYLGQNSTCSCSQSFNFTAETPIENGNDYIVYEGQGITFTIQPIYTDYLYYELVPQASTPFINKNDIANSGLGANNIPLGITGIVDVLGTESVFHIKFATDATEGSEFFRAKLSELVDFDKCPYWLYLSNYVEVKEQVTYTLSGVPYNCQVNEGDTLTLRITTTNAPTGTIYYKITPIVGAQASDFGIALEGSKQITNSIMTLNIPIVADSSTENQEERFKVEFSRTSDFATIIATTDTACTNGIKIIDSSQDELEVNVLLNGSSLDSVVEEGGIATFRVESNQNGDFYYKINTNGTNFSTADLDSSVNPPADIEFEDLFTVTNGFANIYKKVKADFTSETESFKIEVRLNSTQGPIVATSPTAIISDSSGTPSYIISGPSEVFEGSSYNYNIVTTNSPHSTLWYRIVAVGASEITVDDFSIPLSDSFVLSSGSYTLYLPVATDLELENNEQFRIEIWPSSDFSNTANRLTSTGVVTLKDTTQDVSISQTTNILQEGQSVTFTVNTVNISDDQLTYEIIPTYGNIEASDFTSGSLTGSFTLTDIGSSKTGQFTLSLVNNLSYEGEERFVVNIYDSVSQLLITSSPETVVTDADPTYGITPSTTLITEGNSFTVTVTTTNYPNTNIYYRIEQVFGANQIDASDFEDGLEGAIPITSSSVVHTITSIDKSVFSGFRGFKVIISDSYNGIERASTATITLQDANPTYEIEVPGFVVEGESFDFTVNTTNLPENTTLYYKINGLSASDIVGGLTGSFIVTGNTKTVTIQTADNSAYEGPESFTIQIFDNVSLTPPAKVESTSIILLDGVPVYGPLSPNSGTIAEGATQVFTFATTNIASGTVLYYDIIPESGDLNANDFSPATLSGSFTVGSSFSITTAVNPEAEPNESFKIQISSDSGPEYISNVFQIDDTDLTPDYQLTVSKTTITEGLEGVTFTLQASNVPAGTQITYQIEAITGSITPSDFIDGTLSGTITIDASGFATLYKAATNDCQYETSSSPEQFQVVFSKDSKPVAYSPLINILDPAPAFTSIQPFGCINGCGCEEGKVTEGTNVTFTVTGCNIPNNSGQYRALLQRYPFTTGFDNSDVTPFTQNLTFNNNTATFNVFINDTGSNTLYEDGDSFVVKIRPVGASNDLISSGCFTIVNASPTGTVTPSVSSVAEGDQITFNITAQNVPNNSSLQYEIIGLSEEDLVDGQLSGNVIVTESGNEYIGSVTKIISTDSVFGEVESLVFVIYYDGIELDKTSEIPIVDTTTPTVPTYTLTISDRTVGPGQSFIATLATTDVPLGTEFEFRIKGLYGYLPNPNDFIPSEIIRTAVLPKNNKIVLNYEIFEEVENNFSFNIEVYRVLTGLVSGYELVALSDPIRSQIADDCQNGPVSGTYGEGPSLCSVCDFACGYVSFWGTADAFVGYRSEPLRTATSTAICEKFPDDQCPTEDCPNYGSPCEFCDDSQTYDCACTTSDLNSVSYARFTNKQFITVLENGVYKNRKIEESELIAYRNSEILVPIYHIQGHDNLCFDPEVCGRPYSSGAGINVACVAGYGGGYSTCYQAFSENTWNNLKPNTTHFFETGPVWTTTFSSGINAVRKSYGDRALFQDPEIRCFTRLALPPVVPIGSDITDDLFANYRCANQNYLLGAPNPPEGITAAFIADHLNESFTQQLCDLIHVCSRANEGEICQTYFLANCKEQMDSPCLTRAQRYAIINGCTGAYGFTLNNNFVYSSNRDDFVWFFQGIRAGNFTTTRTGNDFRETFPIIEGTTDIREANQCFTYYPVNIDPNENCLIIDFFADPIYYFGILESNIPQYEPDQTGFQCDATILERNRVLVPPQHTGCCYKKNENDSSVDATKQFRTISYFSKDNSLRPKVLDYLRSLDANFIVFSAVDPGSFSAYDFYNGALCEFLMPRHPYFEGPPEGVAAGPYQPGNYEYAYGYKPASGTEGTFYRVNTCRKYDLYERANRLKRDDPTLTLITGYPNTLFSLEGELAECQVEGPINDGPGGGIGYLGDDTTQSPTTTCLIDRGIKNPLTAWPATEQARDGRIHTSDAYVVQIIGHDGGLNNPKLPNNNAPKVFNACFPCRGFIDLPMQGDNPIGDAVFAEYEDIGNGIQRLIIKSYTKEGRYSGHSVGSILARMTLKDQIKQENIYYKDIAEYSLILIGSGIEILHTREVSKQEFYNVLNWNLNPTGITSSSNSRAEKLSLVYHTGVPLDFTFDVNDAQYTKVYWPFGTLIDWTVGSNIAFKDTGGYIGQQGQNVSAYVGRELIAPLFSARVNSTTVHGIFENVSGRATRFITNSDRNAKVNNNIGILRVHKEYDMGGGHKIPNCREKFETLNRDLTDCDLPNNLVMNGMCWITTVIQKDIWEHSYIQNWVSNRELEDPDNTNLNITTFEDWITTTRLTINFQEFILVLNYVISALKTEQPNVYIGTGELDIIPTPITEELYSMRRNNEYVYNMNDLKQAAIKSKNNSYSCFDPDGQSGVYNCSDYFCEFFCPSNASLEATEDSLFIAFNGCDDAICNPNDPSITFNGKFISVPSNSCLQAMVTQLDATYFCSATSKPFTVANVKEVIEIIIENRSNPCVFQYNNKVYRIMKEA